MRLHENRPDLLANAMWTLVILARPVGSEEGAPFVDSLASSTSEMADVMASCGAIETSTSAFSIVSILVSINDLILTLR